MYYSILFEEHQKGYLIETFSDKLNALELLKSILDTFCENDVIFSNNTFLIQENYKINRAYEILTHKHVILSSDNVRVLYMIELDNSYLYHIESLSELDLELILRNTYNNLQYISRNLNEEINISLN